MLARPVMFSAGHGIVLYWKGFFFDAVKLPPSKAKLQQARR